MTYNIKKEKRAYPYLTQLFGVLFLVFAVYMVTLFFRGFAVWVASGEHRELGPPILVFTAIIVCFFIPTWFFLFLLPVSLTSKNDSLVARYPFGITRKYGLNKAFILLQKNFPSEEDTFLLWSPFFKIILIGSLFFDKNEEVAKLLVRK